MKFFLYNILIIKIYTETRDVNLKNLNILDFGAYSI